MEFTKKQQKNICLNATECFQMTGWLYSAAYCHHTAEIRTVSAGKHKRPRRRIHSSSDSITESINTVGRLNTCDVYECRPSSLPDKAEIVEGGGYPSSGSAGPVCRTAG